MKKFLPLLVLLLLVILPLSAYARVISPEERACGVQAAERYQQILSDAHSTYYRALEALMEERNRAYIASWDSEEDRDQRERERDAKRIFRDGVREIRREKSSRVSDAGRQYRDERRDCRYQNS